jgi:TonB family protein
MARTSSLERRIVAMLDPTVDRRPLTRRSALACGGFVLAALLPAASLRVVGQEPAQSFTVQVFDPTGAVLPGVAIELEDAQKATQSATTEGSGRAMFDVVPPGKYRVSASVAGFRTLRAAIAIEGARDRQRSITLQVGELTETVTVRERRPPPGAAPPSRGVVEPLRVGGNIRAPRKLKHISPEYPASMRDAGLEGTVPMEALIGRDGTVTSVSILSADVHPEFARAAVDAVSQWVFSPTLLNGEAVDVRMAVSVRFSLQD